jgi:hypothetical protein
VSWKDFVSKLNDELMHKKETMLKGKLLIRLFVYRSWHTTCAGASPHSLELIISLCGYTVIVVVTGTFLAWALLVAAVLGYAVCCVHG